MPEFVTTPFGLRLAVGLNWTEEDPSEAISEASKAVAVSGTHVATLDDWPEGKAACVDADSEGPLEAGEVVPMLVALAECASSNGGPWTLDQKALLVARVSEHPARWAVMKVVRDSGSDSGEGKVGPCSQQEWDRPKYYSGPEDEPREFWVEAVADSPDELKRLIEQAMEDERSWCVPLYYFDAVEISLAAKPGQMAEIDPTSAHPLDSALAKWAETHPHFGRPPVKSHDGTDSHHYTASLYSGGRVTWKPLGLRQRCEVANISAAQFQRWLYENSGATPRFQAPTRGWTATIGRKEVESGIVAGLTWLPRASGAPAPRDAEVLATETCRAFFPMAAREGISGGNIPLFHACAAALRRAFPRSTRHGNWIFLAEWPANGGVHDRYGHWSAIATVDSRLACEPHPLAEKLFDFDSEQDVLREVNEISGRLGLEGILIADLWSPSRVRESGLRMYRPLLEFSVKAAPNRVDVRRITLDQVLDALEYAKGTFSSSMPNRIDGVEPIRAEAA